MLYRGNYTFFPYQKIKRKEKEGKNNESKIYIGYADVSDDN